VILDEVHERTIESDFLLIILRDLLPLRPDLKVRKPIHLSSSPPLAGGHDSWRKGPRIIPIWLIVTHMVVPQVILMSATMNSEMFASYFGGCPIVEIPGFTHPVQQFFLEDAVEVTGVDLRAAAMG